MTNGFLKVAVVFGTRPECIKLAPVIRALDCHKRMESTVICSSQHTDLLAPFLGGFDIKVQHDLKVMRAGQSPNEVLSRVLLSLEKVFSQDMPDVVLVQGDTTTALAGAISAFHANIPVGHVEAGLRTGDIRAPFPEEMNRRLISRIASYHYAATEENVKNLRNEKVPDSSIWLTGNPVVDSLQWILENHPPSARIKELLRRHAGKKLIVLTTHRRESFGRTMENNLRAIADFVASNSDIIVLFPVHPNPNVRNATREVLGNARGFDIIDPMDYSDFIHLLSSAWLIVSDSGGIQEEAPCLGKRLIVLRSNTERPEVVDAGIAKLIGDNPQRLTETLQTADNDPEWSRAALGAQSLYGSGDAGYRIIRALETVFVKS